MAVELFVDTSAWFALARPPTTDRDQIERAMRQRLRAGSRLVTTNLIVAETHALLLRRAGPHAALKFLHEVTKPPIGIVGSTPEIEARAIREWIERYDDQAFSFTDAVSFEVMTARGIREALTLDRHFATAGFGMLPPKDGASEAR